MKNCLLSFIIMAVTSGMYCLAAKAQPPVCAGHNLMQAMDAQTRTAIEERAAKTANGQGRFWKIEKAGIVPSWLMGTMHVSDDRVTRLSEPEKKAFEQAGTLALELKEVAKGQNALMSVFTQNPDMFAYPNGETLKKLLTDEQFKELDDALKERNLSYRLVSQTKPWLIWSLLSVPSCEFHRESMGILSLDTKLGIDALAAGKQVEGLETPEEQLQAINRLPISFHVDSIIEIIRLGDTYIDYYMTMIELYLAGKISTIPPFSESITPELTRAKHAGIFQKVMLDDRNARMAARAAPLLARGNSFIAVGALHLIGEKGLIERFRHMGYKVTLISN